MIYSCTDWNGVSCDGIESNYEYNGLGDRLKQIVDDVTTNYTLDLNSGLTQVLSEGGNFYLYGLGRIGEQGGGQWNYHLADDFGSLRQLGESMENTMRIVKSLQFINTPPSTNKKEVPNI